MYVFILSIVNVLLPIIASTVDSYVCINIYPKILTSKSCYVSLLQPKTSSSLSLTTLLNILVWYARCSTVFVIVITLITMRMRFVMTMFIMTIDSF